MRTRTTTTSTTAGRAPGRHIKVNRMALRFVIKGSGMTHAQIARKAGLSSAATVSNLVANGAKGGSSGRGTCRPETAKAISKALGLGVADMREVFVVVLSDSSR